MGDRYYNFLRKIASPFRYRCVDLNAGKITGAVIYVSNHQGASGPIECILTIQRRLLPWIIVDMVDPSRIADYLLQDFVRPALHIEGTAGKMLAKGIGKIALPLLQGIDCIPVDRHDARFLGAFRQSLNVLASGGALLILPENPDTPPDPTSEMRSFRNGFLWLCLQYKRVTGVDLPVVPVAVSPKAHTVVVGQPLYYVDHGQPKLDRLRLADALRNRISGLLAEAPHLD